MATPWILIIAGAALIGAGIYFTVRPVQKASPVQETSPSSTILCLDGPCAPTHKKSGPEYFKEMGLGVGGPEPLVLSATPIVTTDRLRIFVDYSEYRSGWMPKTRAFIGEIKDPVKGKTEKVQMIYYLANKPNAGTNNLWWGDPTHNHPVTASTFNGQPLPAIIVRARLAIVGLGGEQHHYFMLVRDAANTGTYVGVLPEHDSGDWIESWENE